ncbi:unnamed protein product [Auanema sp. JU1783]|nr:unnamed protein product [Auanema sp. JU1783]
MSERESILCSVGCSCAKTSALFAALPESQRCLRTSTVTAIYELERVTLHIHQELGHFCWLYASLDRESLEIINNGPLELDSFMERLHELHAMCRRLAFFSETHDLRAAFLAWKLPCEAAGLRLFAKELVENIQENIDKELRRREDHVQQLKVFSSCLELEEFVARANNR